MWPAKETVCTKALGNPELWECGRAKGLGKACPPCPSFAAWLGPSPSQPPLPGTTFHSPNLAGPCSWPGCPPSAWPLSLSPASHP